jgi:acetolactate synthase-1/2/3 large subunit
MKTSKQIATMLQDYGVTHFFFEPVILPETVKAMAEIGITPVMTHGEKSAVYMADGYARISGGVGVCGSQAIGSTNLAAGLRDPYMARSAVIALYPRPAAPGLPRGVQRHTAPGAHRAGRQHRQPGRPGGR